MRKSHAGLSDEGQVRKRIEDWASAISSGDRAAILAHHSRDVLMFDFPPPIVEGIDAYDRTWDFFFAAPKGPISFVPSRLRVTQRRRLCVLLDPL